MKYLFRAFGFIALAAVIGFGFVGCVPGAGGTTEGYLISGKFESKTSAGDAVFYADYAQDARSARAVGGLAATEKELTGKIEDGDIIFNLKGVYDTAAKTFFLSAGSSVLIYQIAGTLSESGTMSDTSAAVKVKDTVNDKWVTHEVDVIAAENTEITKAADTEQEDGIPSAWFGLWNGGEGTDGSRYILSSFQLISPDYPGQSAGLVEIVPVTAGQKYEAIYQVYVHHSTGGSEGPVDEGSESGGGGSSDEPGGDEPSEDEETITMKYIKMTMEAEGADLKWTMYNESMNEVFAETKKFNTQMADSEKIEIAILSRP